MAGISPSAETPRYSSAYAIFEGGGAKGLYHVGAIKALEEERLALVGVAGTSAGAIVAALVAVGYRADEIFTDSQNNILQKLNVGSPINLLGAKQWRKMKSPIRKPHVISISLLIGLIFALAGAATAVAGKADANSLMVKLVGGAAMLFLLLGLAGLIAWAIPLLGNQGFFDSSTIRRVVNQALRAKLKEHYESLGIDDEVPEDVRFSHIDPGHIAKCVPLKIVVTDVSSGELTLFDGQTPNVVVADAVAASAAVPGVFRPAFIPGSGKPEGTLFADGGLVSNLPSWTFREEKKARERLETRNGATGRIPVLAFALQELPKPGQALRAQALRRYQLQTSLRYFRNVLFTGIFGGQKAIQDFVPDLRVIQLKTVLTTFDFDCSGEQAEQAAKSGQSQAARFLRRERLRDTLTQAVLDEILVLARKYIDANTSADKPRLRIVLIDPISRSSIFNVIGHRVTAGAGMDDDCDDSLELDIRGEIAAKAYRENIAVFGKIGNEKAGTLWMTKYEHALLPRDLRSVIAIPIYAKPDQPDWPRRVLALDSSGDLEQSFNDTEFMNMFKSAGAKVSRTLIENAIEALEE